MFTNRFRILFTLAVAVAGVSAQSFDACGEACVNSTLAAGICKSLCGVEADQVVVVSDPACFTETTPAVSVAAQSSKLSSPPAYRIVHLKT
jgi:hypothetical protein